MSFDWHEYFEFAEECQLNAAKMVSQDAALRSAISRAYYSVFCQARNKAISRGISVPATGQAHTLVMNYFKRATNINEKRVGTELDRLKAHRRSADYDDNFQGDLAKVAAYAITSSRHAHTIIASLP